MPTGPGGRRNCPMVANGSRGFCRRWSPVFAIRKPAVAVFTLDDYVRRGILSADQAAVLAAGVAGRGAREGGAVNAPASSSAVAMSRDVGNSHAEWEAQKYCASAQTVCVYECIFTVYLNV